MLVEIRLSVILWRSLDSLFTRRRWTPKVSPVKTEMHCLRFFPMRSFIDPLFPSRTFLSAVTLDGTVIHKSGLITGGQTEQSTTKRWDEREYQGLQRQRDQFMVELKELNKEKRALNVDDELMVKITKLEAELVIVNDELVSSVLGERSCLKRRRMTHSLHFDSSSSELGYQTSSRNQ